MGKVKEEANGNTSQQAIEQARRNRVNQRNYRARQQQRIKELQADQQQHREASISASQEVQRAAQIVVAENAILRDILINELGYSEADLAHKIRCRLFGMKDTAQSSVTSEAPTAAITPRSRTSKSNPVDVSQSKNTCGGRVCKPQQQMSSPTATSNAMKIASSSTHSRAAEHSTLIQSVMTIDTTSTLPPNNSTRMSCVKAAEILSSLRSYQTSDEIRKELGCADGNVCDIDNIDLMQAMDRSV